LRSVKTGKLRRGPEHAAGLQHPLKTQQHDPDRQSTGNPLEAWTLPVSGFL